MGGMPTSSSVAEEIAFRVVAPNLEVRQPGETASKSYAQPLPWVVRLTERLPALRLISQLADNQKHLPTYLFYYPDCEPLARRIVEASQGQVQLGNIRWG